MIVLVCFDGFELPKVVEHGIKVQQQNERTQQNLKESMF